ncbi:C-type lectin domain family 10 member A-like isoform X2 [Gymnodraco acuticeps]|nr:C-type lectin domain family 10 member A-like isoform X2 [Gymnodraco acuticeps]XP_034073346.1 C-type lectin domain family 10 member A-like isoform X2 [Gymnodraco acuticeps]
MGLRIYLTSELSGNNAELYSRIQELETRENNLTQKIQNLTAGVQELTTKNQELEKKTKNLTQKIQDMTTNWNELNVSRAQWSIDSYCLGNTDDKCQACQKGWSLTEPSCYVYNDAETDNQKTWEEAQGDCRGRNSDLAVAHDSEEKEAIKKNSLGSNEFWIGLRVEDGKWKWVDGSDLSDSSWIDPPADGHCALFYTGRDIWYSVFYTNKWSSVSCGATHQWICQQKALSV